MAFSGSVSEPASVTVQGVPAVVGTDTTFKATVPLASGTNTITVKATDPSGNVGTNQYEVDSLGTGRTFTYDANGNLTSDGTRTFEWDAMNQLVAMNAGTHRSEFFYDGHHRRMRIVEKEGAALLSDRNYTWCGSDICEERDNSGVTVLTRFLSQGSTDGVAVQYYAADHLGSIREVVDAAGVIRARYEYGPYGDRVQVQGDLTVPFGFTGHFVDKTSGLVLTLHRAYDTGVTRWLSEDPTGLQDGPNMYTYVSNQPTVAIDLLGLQSIGSHSSQPDPTVRPGCTATPWRIYRTESSNEALTRKWRLVRAREIKVVLPVVANGKMLSMSLGYCICEWASSGIVWAMHITKHWSRTVTCCGTSSFESDITKEERLYETPVIGHRKATTKAPMTVSGCACKRNPPSGAM